MSGPEAHNLQKNGHPDCRNQGRDAARRAGLGPLQRIAIGRDPDNGHKGRPLSGFHQWGKPQMPRTPAIKRARERAKHIDFAMGKVDQLDNAVNQRIAMAIRGIDAAPRKAAEEQFYKKLYVHRKIVLGSRPVHGGRGPASRAAKDPMAFSKCPSFCHVFKFDELAIFDLVS